MYLTRYLYRTVLLLALQALVAPIANAAPAAGQVPPAYVGDTLENDPVLLTDLHGKAVVVTFWATWCPYCLKELPILNSVQTVAGKDKLLVIAVNTESRDIFRKVSRGLRSLDLQLAYDPDRKAQEAYGVRGIPHMVIVGRDGKIVAVYRGYSEDSLDSILASINRATGAIP
jgi:thiol-disulfide isomerase/thioredoxin